MISLTRINRNPASRKTEQKPSLGRGRLLVESVLYTVKLQKCHCLNQMK